MGMSASPLERITPAFATLAGYGGAQAGREALAAGRSFWPHLAVLTAFWIYVALSNVLYANNMQASFSTMKMERVFAPWDARLIQHLLLYPLFLLSMWRSPRTGWRPLWRAVPIQLLCALGFAVLAAPALVTGEHLLGQWEHEHPNSSGHSWTEFLAGPEIPIWIASATNFLVTYGFGLALITGFAFYQRLRDSQLRSAALERALTQAHLAALRMQLSPHTLFNLLHTIRGQIIWDPPAAQSMIVQLGDLLRRLLAAGELEFSGLSSELQFARLYLELQQKRFADRLAIVLPDLEVLPSARVPSLILQPLIENAVVHGLARHDGAVEIRVEIETAVDPLVLRVVNTMAPDAVAAPDGIGLRNVRERLALHFGDRASLAVGPNHLHQQ